MTTLLILAIGIFIGWNLPQTKLGLPELAVGL
jgi:hypothetical protein